MALQFARLQLRALRMDEHVITEAVRLRRVYRTQSEISILIHPFGTAVGVQVLGASVGGGQNDVV